VTPRRTCVGCRAALSPDTGLRVTRDVDGALVIGRTAPGRGAWLCRATAWRCAAAATKRRAWGRALRAEVSAAAAGELQRWLETAAGVGPGGPDR
jgi:predicted RNA-binding protein YlxR (DUF448 family)